MEHGEERRGYDAREGKRAESKPKAAVFKLMIRTFRRNSFTTPRTTSCTSKFFKPQITQTSTLTQIAVFGFTGQTEALLFARPPSELGHGTGAGSITCSDSDTTCCRT